MAVEEVLASGVEPVRRPHVDAHEIGVGSRCHAGTPPDEQLASRRSCQGDHDPLPGLPGLADAVSLSVLREAFVDPVREPEQRELAQRGEVADAEVVSERGVDLLCGVDVPVRHPSPQGLGRHVDELDLVCAPDDGVRDGLSLSHAGDALDDVVERLEVLDVDCRDHRDSGGQQLLDVLPSLLVPAARDVGVCELVDEGHLRGAGQHGIGVHLLEDGSAIADLLSRDDLEIADRLLCQRATMGLDEPDHDIGASLMAASPFAQHRDGLADARGSAYVDPELTTSHAERSAVTSGRAPRSARGR